MDPRIARAETIAAAPSAKVRATRARRWLRALVFVCSLFLLSLIGAGFTVTSFGAQTYHWRAFDVEVGIQPAMQGQTRLIFAPLGEVRAQTHATPMALNISLRGISFDKMKQLIVAPPPRKELEQEFEAMAQRSLRDFAWRQVALGAAGALLIPLLLRLRRPGWWGFCAVCGGGFVALTFLGTLRTFDKKAFETPTYTGSLREAGWIIALVKDGFMKVETLSEKLRGVARNLNTLYGRLNNVPGLAADVDTIHVLHVSDIHNNPAAVDFIRELAEKMRVDAVIDTGDLTDLGTPLETQLSGGLARLNAPYLFVAGNHDSQATVLAVRANRNAHILHNEPVAVAGLVVLGAPDPSSARFGPGSVDTPLDSLRAAADQLAADYRRAPAPPEIVCVHNPRQAESLVGQAALILCGHLHRAEIKVERGTVICNAGTTGAAGVRYFDRKEGVPFSAALLTFARSPRPHLLFIDQIVLEGSLGQYSIRRQTFNGLPHP